MKEILKKEIGEKYMNKKDIGRKASALAFSLVMVLAIFASVPSAMAASAKTYTLDADFQEGILANVEHDTVHDQLQLSKKLVSLPLIWVPNSDEGTVSKVDTDTGKELSRYLTGPTTGGSPSRTTVDLMGNVWFGNRNTGTVVKIGLFENGQCKDKNGNGIIETSQDSNNDGDVTGAEILPWGTDECVLHEVTGITGARGIAVDANNNLWAGGWATSQYTHIDGETGAILTTVASNPAYGAVIDANGILWSSEWTNPSVGKLDPAGPSYTSINVGETGGVYGMGIDANNNLFISGYFTNTVSKYDISTGLPVWKWTTADGGLSQARGVVVTNDGDVWVAASGSDLVYRLDNNGVIKASISVGVYPTGVSVDNNGKVWVVNYNDGYIKRIDPATNTVDLEKLILGNDGTGISHHYGYSDMTGYVARTITTKTGTWTVDFDSGTSGTPWGTASWNSIEPAGTQVNVRVRSSDDKATWSGWEDTTNGVKLTTTPNGRYLQIETTLQITSGDVSPILYDLTVKVGNQPPIANPGGPYVENEGSAITFVGSTSSDPDAGDSIVNYEWDLDGDGTFESSGATITKTWLDDYSGTLTLKVTDTYGATNTADTTVTVNNVAPTVTITGPAAGSIYAVNTPVTFTGTYTDPGTDDTHTAQWTFDSINTPVPGQPVTAGSVSTSYTFTAPGVYQVKLTVTDDNLGVGIATTVGVQDAYVVVYDPSGGFVTGGGSIDSQAGAYVPYPALAGRANFGFVSKYQKGATIPTGETEFQFKVGSLNFHSVAYDYLVIAGARAQYKGTGTINGAGDFGFLLTAVDGQITGGEGVDKFRIKIWDRTTDTVIYDNAAGSDDLSASPTQTISGGSIVIHKK